MMRLVCVGVALALVLGDVGSAKADIVFDFQFDNNPNGPDGTITPPVVGTGSLTLLTDPGNGTFTLASLLGYSMSFSFGADTFTQANVASNPNLVLVVISDFGMDRRVYFTDTGAGGGGPFGGSLDFVNGANGLSFEPSYVGGHNLYFEINPVNFFFGNYLGLTTPGVPEPSSLALAGLAFVTAAGYVGWRRKPVMSA